MRKLIIIIDTCCINLKRKDSYLNQLEKWHKEGLIEIRKTFAMNDDFRENGSADRRIKSSEYQEDRGISILGVPGCSPIPMRIGGKEQHKKFKKIEEIYFKTRGIKNPSPSDCRGDFMHLQSAILSGSDIFVTKDVKHFIGKDNKIRKAIEKDKDFDILIRTPKEAVDYINKTLKIQREK